MISTISTPDFRFVNSLSLVCFLTCASSILNRLNRSFVKSKDSLGLEGSLSLTWNCLCSLPIYVSRARATGPKHQMLQPIISSLWSPFKLFLPYPPRGHVHHV